MSGLQLIEVERHRQINKGWSEEHDDGHGDGSLLHAAILVGCGVAGLSLEGCEPPSIQGPWPDQLALRVADKYKTSTIRQLAIAGAMIAAEIDRRIRACEK